MTLTLIAVTWRGPIPCLHSHSNDAIAVRNDPQLAWHLRSFHAGHCGEDHEAHWHFHFVRLRDLREGDVPCPDEPTSDDPLQAQPIVPQWSVTDVRTLGLLEWNPLATVMTAISKSVAPHCGSIRIDIHDSGGERELGFLSSLLFAAPLCAVTGVALC